MSINLIPWTGIGHAGEKMIKHRIRIRHLKNGENHQAYELARTSNGPMSRILAQAMEVNDQDRKTLEAVKAMNITKQPEPADSVWPRRRIFSSVQGTA